MPELSTILVFAAACLALTATPGPDMMLVASRGVSQGRSAGFMTLAGIQAGTYCHAAAAAFGLSQLFLAVPMAYDLVRWAGAAYLLFLAWKALRPGGTGLAVTGDLARRSLRRAFGEGLATNLLNPKMALFVLALFPQFVDPSGGPVAMQVLVLATILNAIGLVVNGAVIVLASHMRARILQAAWFERASRLLLGTVFAGLALRLALDDRR
ncbi:LysE family translocator [Arenibaculum sp.]|jgi:threonine/homoserine/homoserine lactone efflux protein|uniref:LysE family translocator n=1 Tax=Arenibaculum sp. TaxID=2865862 RepID=UPI002E11DA39|nr:LysE family translocator [Arenibaculum sp.]